MGHFASLWLIMVHYGSFWLIPCLVRAVCLLPDFDNEKVLNYFTFDSSDLLT